jgi:hypothetical protein
MKRAVPTVPPLHGSMSDSRGSRGRWGAVSEGEKKERGEPPKSAPKRRLSSSSSITYMAVEEHWRRASRSENYCQLLELGDSHLCRLALAARHASCPFLRLLYAIE